MKSILIVFTSISLLSICVGCSRDKAEEKSSVRFDFGELSRKSTALNTQTLIDFIAINISGPGMKRMICRYESPDQNRPAVWSGPCNQLTGQGSNVIEIPDIPIGSNRLVQVLMIREVKDLNADTESEFFDYGEARTALAPGDNRVDIRMQANPTASNKEMTAAGRIQMPDGSFYTGAYSLQFAPPGGSQPMTIFTFEMFSGWFFAYLLDNIDLQYKLLRTGNVLFGGPVNQRSPQFAPSSGVLRVTTPQRFYDRNGNTDSDPENLLALGFWIGNSADNSKVACYDAAPADSTYDHINDTLTNTLSWPSEFVIEGGSSCTMPNPAVGNSRVAVNSSVMLEGGGGGAPTFYGPYQWFLDQDGNYNPVSGQVSGNEFEMSWRYLPGVLGNGFRVAGTAIFFKSAPIKPEFQGLMEGANNGFDCKRFEEEGYARAFLDQPQRSFVLPVSPTQAQDLFDNGQVALCPYRKDSSGQRIYFRTVLDLYNNHGGGGGGGGGGSSPANKIVLTNIGPFSFPYTNTNTCTPINVRLENDNGLAEPTGGGPYEVDVSVSPVEGGFFTDPGCSLSIGTVTIDHGPEKTVYYQGSTPTNPITFLGETTNTMAVTLTTGSLPSDLRDNTANTPAGVTAVTVPFTYYSTKCEVIPIMVVDSNGVPTYNAGQVEVSLSAVGESAGPYGQFFAPTQCNSAPNLSIATIAPGFPVGAVEYLAGSSDDITITGDDGGALSDFTVTISTEVTPAAQYAVIEGNNGEVFDANACNSNIRIATYYYDSSEDRPIPAFPSAPVNYSFAVDSGLSSGAFYPPSSGCTPAVSGLQQTTGQTFIEFDFASPDSGPKNFKFVIDDPADTIDDSNIRGWDMRLIQ